MSTATTKVSPLLVTGDDNGLIKVWDLTQVTPILRVTFGQQTSNRAVQAICWVDPEMTVVLASFADGTTMTLPTTQSAATSHPVLSVDRGDGCFAATSSSMQIVGGNLVLATKNDGVFVLDIETGTKKNFLLRCVAPKEREISAIGGVGTKHEFLSKKHDDHKQWWKHKYTNMQKEEKEKQEEEFYAAFSSSMSNNNDSGKTTSSKEKKQKQNAENLIAGTSSSLNPTSVKEKHLNKKEVSTSFDAVHIHRRVALVAAGGKNNDLVVWDISSKAIAENKKENESSSDENNNKNKNKIIFAPPLFIADNVDDHILGVEHPTYVTGVCVIDYHTFTTVTAYHQVRFYDRRVSRKPIQEFTIGREIDRRPTSVLQYNINKYLLGEAGGDLHLYDTRRGFSSRAKLKGGDGSVRCIAKHPEGFPIVATTGLDRVARIFHVPTGKQLQLMFLKQQGTCCLLSKGAPAQVLGASVGKNVEGVTNWQSHVNTKKDGGSTKFENWDEIDALPDDLIEDEIVAPTNTSANNASAAAAAAASDNENTKNENERKKKIVSDAVNATISSNSNVSTTTSNNNKKKAPQRRTRS